MPASEALAVLTRHGPSTCDPVARVLQGALAAAADRLGTPAATCVVLRGDAGDTNR